MFLEELPKEERTILMFLRRVTKGREKHMNVSEKGYQRKKKSY
jgi:hypothetical protein